MWLRVEERSRIFAGTTLFRHKNVKLYRQKTLLGGAKLCSYLGVTEEVV